MIQGILLHIFGYILFQVPTLEVDKRVHAITIEIQVSKTFAKLRIIWLRMKQCIPEN